MDWTYLGILETSPRGLCMTFKQMEYWIGYLRWESANFQGLRIEERNVALKKWRKRKLPWSAHQLEKLRVRTQVSGTLTKSWKYIIASKSSF